VKRAAILRLTSTQIVKQSAGQLRAVDDAQISQKHDSDAADLIGEWYVASCMYFEDGSVYVHFVGFPIDCDVLVAASEVSKRIRKHVKGTPQGPLDEGSASWTPNQALFVEPRAVNSAVHHLQHQESALIASAAQNMAVLRESVSLCLRLSLNDADSFDSLTSQLECLRQKLHHFKLSTLESIHEEAAVIKTKTLQELRQVSSARQPYIRAQAHCIPATVIVTRSRLEACSLQKIEAAARVEELKAQLAKAEESLQSAVAEEESLTRRLSSLSEKSASFAQGLFEEDTAREAVATDAIEERFQHLDCQIKLQESECRALEMDIDDALQTMQARRQSWQLSVCGKTDSEINTRDVRLLFEFLKINVSSELIALHRVDGKVLSNLSVNLLRETLGVSSFKDRLLLHHLQFCIKNAVLDSCLFNVGAGSPLSWNIDQIETWLVQQALSFVVDEFRAENLNGMALLQLNEELLQNFKACKASLKHSQEVWSAIQQLRALSDKPRKHLSNGSEILQISHSEIAEIAIPPMRGSSGSVYKVKYQGMDAAKKQPHLARPLNDRDRSKFMKELEIAHKARNPHIVSMFGACFDDQGMFLLMEWMEGGSLYDALGNHKTKPIVARKRISIAREIAGGLAYLHKIGIVHRDIKSLNVLLTADGHAKLCDFGLATLHTLTTTASSATSAHEGRQAGTVHPSSAWFSVILRRYSALDGTGTAPQLGQQVQ
jgi:tRNA A-37 threonylcarbamoyl transferase component Bud32